MSTAMIRFSLVLFFLIGLTGWPGQKAASCASPDNSLPSWAKVDRTIVSHFEALPDYAPGDLILQSQVRSLLARLANEGWKVADGQEILALVPEDGEFLARTLRGPAGRKFMRQIAGYPDGYDRLDRLGRMRRGRKTVESLVRGPDGYKMIEYMTTSRGGRGLGKQLSRAPNGNGFNQPTRRIYTVKALRERLKKSYRAAANLSGR